MDFLKRPPQGKSKISSNMPLDLSGCWQTKSGLSGIRFIAFSVTGGSYVSDGVTDFKVTSNGREMTWSGIKYDRVLGKQKSRFGSWALRNYPSEIFYLAEDGNSLWHENSLIALRGCHKLISGTDERGEMIYWEKRSAVLINELAGEITFLLEWGATLKLYYSVSGDVLTLERSDGSIFKYKKVMCHTDLW
jgi:hypothetical protein